MAAAKNGDQVAVHYKGTLDDKTVFDESAPDNPLTFKIGAGEIIPGFEKAVMGMSEGDSKTVTMPSADAYGQHREDLILSIDRGKVPPDITVEVGQQLQMEKDNGELLHVVVTEVTDETVTLDANHPLAGKDLTFEIKLVSLTE